MSGTRAGKLGLVRCVARGSTLRRLHPMEKCPGCDEERPAWAS
jgi:hypothetical protein